MQAIGIQSVAHSEPHSQLLSTKTATYFHPWHGACSSGRLCILSIYLVMASRNGHELEKHGFIHAVPSSRTTNHHQLLSA